MFKKKHASCQSPNQKHLQELAHAASPPGVDKGSSSRIRNSEAGRGEESEERQARSLCGLLASRTCPPKTEGRKGAGASRLRVWPGGVVTVLAVAGPPVAPSCPLSAHRCLSPFCSQMCTSSPRCPSCGRSLSSLWSAVCPSTSSSTCEDGSRPPATPSSRRRLCVRWAPLSRRTEFRFRLSHRHPRTLQELPTRAARP